MEAARQLLRSRTPPAIPFGSRPAPAASVPLTSFIGRDQEIVAVVNLLGRARLVTLTGPPGTGKTRLALAVTSAVAGRFAGGAVVVLLAPVSDARLVAASIAQALGAREPPGRPLLESLKSFLRGMHFLLVLDNFEHLLPAAPEVTELLVACPELTVLATSRAHLNVQGEHIFEVPPLTLPAAEARPSVPRILQAEAVQLFDARARAARDDFRLTEHNAGAVAGICRHLDGLPLAIELAAARSAVLPPLVLAERLTDRLRLLTGGARDLPARQQTLRNAITWSDDLLTEQERLLFYRLAVFAGGFTLEAAEAICPGEGLTKAGILHGLAGLVASSLVSVEGSAGAARYRLLETVREYALEHLLATPESMRALQRRHRDWYLALAERIGARVREGRQWMDALGDEHDNLRRALTWSSQEPAEVEAGLRLAGALREFWQYQGFLSEGRQWLATFLALPTPAVSPLARAKALFAAGTLAWTKGDFAASDAYFEEQLDLSRAVGDRGSEAEALLGLGTTAILRVDYARSRALHEQALSLFRQLADQPNLVVALFQLGLLTVLEEDFGRAWALLEEALALARQAGDKTGLAYTRSMLGVVCIGRGNLEEAGRLLMEALSGVVELGDRWGLPNVLDGFMALAAARRLDAQAVRLHGATIALRAAIETPPSPTFQQFNERSLVPARKRLGEAAAQAAWAEGQAMTMDEAIAAARAVAEPPPSAAPKAAPAVARHADDLTAREREVALLVAQGLSNQEIAAALVISERTAETHVGHVLGKLGLSSRTQVAAWDHEHSRQDSAPGPDS